MYRFNLIILIFCFSPLFPAFSQESVVNCSDSTFCIPSVIGLPRTKGIEIRRELVKDYSIKSESNEGFGNSQGEVRRNRRWELKLKAPVVLKEGFKMAVGIKYFVEEFNFEDLQNPEYPFYQNLEDRSLKSFRAEVFMIKPTRTNKYFILRMSGGLNGDYSSSSFANENFLRFSASPLFGWKKSNYLSYAVGFAYSYNFGRQAIYPLFSYMRSFNNQWGIESILPVNLKLRYSTLNQKNYFYLKSELNGANYGIRMNSNENELVYLNKSELRFLLTWEREIHDWLWFGIDAGVRYNIDFDLTNTPRRRQDIVVSNSLNDALVLGFSIFVVPPRKMLQ